MPAKMTDHEKEKAVWFTAVSHDAVCRDIIKKNCQEFATWYWIDHQPDKETEEADKHFHTHVVVMANGTRSIWQVAQTLDIPPNFVQVVRQKRSMLRYLIHLDNPEKIQYKPEDIHTNKPSSLSVQFTDNQDDDVRRLFRDLDKLAMGRINRSQFVDLHFPEIQKMPFYQKIRVYGQITELAYSLSDQVRRTT